MKTKNVTEKNMKVCLVGSSGGHLTHLYMLKPFWKDKNRFWVTFDKEDARSFLEGEKVYTNLVEREDWCAKDKKLHRSGNFR